MLYSKVHEAMNHIMQGFPNKTKVPCSRPRGGGGTIRTELITPCYGWFDFSFKFTAYSTFVCFCFFNFRLLFQNITFCDSCSCTPSPFQPPPESERPLNVFSSSDMPVLPCCGLAVWPRCLTAPRSFRTRWNSTRCLRPEVRCLFERLHRSCLLTHKNTSPV